MCDGVVLQVHNAGHMVPMDQPKASLQMLQNWMQGKLALDDTHERLSPKWFFLSPFVSKACSTHITYILSACIMLYCVKYYYCFDFMFFKFILLFYILNMLIKLQTTPHFLWHLHEVDFLVVVLVFVCWPTHQIRSKTKNIFESFELKRAL